MNLALETSLKHARYCRDWGNWILILFLVIEFLLEIWPEVPHDWSPWSPPRKYVLWLDGHRSVKRWATIGAAAMIVAGVGIETYWGLIIDNFVDDMRIAAKPRPELLWGESGTQLIARLKPWAGQYVEVRFCPVYLSNDEVMQTAMRFGTVLSVAGWKGEPTYQIGPIGSGWIAPRESTCGTGQGLLVQKSALAPKQTEIAAKGLIAALKSASLEVTDSVNNLVPMELQPMDSSSVVLTVFAHPL
jgi:hypothetical protein